MRNRRVIASPAAGGAMCAPLMVYSSGGHGQSMAGRLDEFVILHERHLRVPVWGGEGLDQVQPASQVCRAVHAICDEATGRTASRELDSHLSQMLNA